MTHGYSLDYQRAKQPKRITRYDTIEEARATAQRKANSLKANVTITYTSHEGRQELCEIVRPEKSPRKLAIFKHMNACMEEGMTVEEAAYAWRVGDYRC